MSRIGSVAAALQRESRNTARGDDAKPNESGDDGAMQSCGWGFSGRMTLRVVCFAPAFFKHQVAWPPIGRLRVYDHGNRRQRASARVS